MNRVYNFLQGLPLVHSIVRRKMLIAAGISVGRNSTVYPDVFFGSSKCSIADRVFINTGCFIDGSDWVRIGNDVLIGPHVKFLTSSHSISTPARRGGQIVTAPIEVEEGCWIGASATILPGIIISKGCIIAAGALLSKNTIANGLYAGVPAKRVRELPLDTK